MPYTVDFTSALLLEMRRMQGEPQTSQNTVVITGAYGFVGANLCNYFLQQGWRVAAIEGPQGLDWRLPANLTPPPQAALQRYKVDITCASAVHDMLQQAQPTLIINAAAYGAYAAQADTELIYRVNTTGVRLLLEAARQLPALRAFVQLGSSSEYGSLCQAPSEHGPLWPDSHYAVSKVAASALVRFYASKYGIPGFVLRLYAVYGPLEDASRLIATLLRCAQAKRLPPLVNPLISRDFIHVDDVAEAIAMLYARAPQLKRGDYFNLGTGICTTLRQLVALSCELFGIAEAPQWGSMPARHWDHADWYANPHYTTQSLGWSSRIDLAAGLQRTMQWMQTHPDLLHAALAHQVSSAPPSARDGAAA